MAVASIGDNSAIPGHDRNTEVTRARHDQPVCLVSVQLAGQEEASIAISGVNEASLMPGPAITRANQVFGSGMNWTARLRPAEGLLSSPTSHAEIGETNIPSAAPACRIAAVAELAMGSPLASQITAQVSSNTAAA